MKNKIAICVVFLLVAIVYAASFDRRGFNQNQGEPVFRVEVPQLVGDPNSATDINDTVNLNGTIRQITVGVSDNTGDKTATIDIIDDNGSVLFTSATIAEDTASAPTMQHFMAISAADANSIPLAVLVTGEITINANLSGDVGHSGVEIDVVLYGD